MNSASHLSVFMLVTLATSHALAQRGSAPPARPAPATNAAWSFYLSADGYLEPGEQGYINPNISADHRWLHLEARYNYEDLRTGSLWLGYNIVTGQKLQLAITPMIGGVFGRTTGVAPGCEAALTYKKVQLAISNEYVFDTGDRSSNFFYNWPEITYSPRDWLHVGLVAQQTKIYHSPDDIQGGFLIGISHKKIDLTGYVFTLGPGTPTAVMEAGFSF